MFHEQRETGNRTIFIIVPTSVLYFSCIGVSIISFFYPCLASISASTERSSPLFLSVSVFASAVAHS